MSEFEERANEILEYLAKRLGGLNQNPKQTDLEYIASAIEAAVEKERESCAKIAEKVIEHDDQCGQCDIYKSIAKAIREHKS